jgi:hypothetical protein
MPGTRPHKVAWTLGAAQLVRVHQQQLYECQRHRGGVVGDQEGSLQPGGRAAVGEDRDQVGENPLRKAGREEVQRETNRCVDEPQPEKGVGKPDCDHERTRAVLGPARPGHKAGRDERPAHPDDRDQQVGERPRPSIAGPEYQREVHQAPRPLRRGPAPGAAAGSSHLSVPSSAPTAAPDSSALEMNPRAPERSTRSP